MTETNGSDTRTPDQQASPGDRLAADMAAVVREEVHALRQEFADAARPATQGLLLIGAAAGCAVLGVGAASTTVLRMLEWFLPRRLAAAGLAAGYFAAAAVLGSMGLDRLRAAGGSSERLAEGIRDAVSDTVGRVVPAGASAAKEAVRSDGDRGSEDIR
jgi:Putative Actinobacterial Holin-X, holin superfamily III